MSVVQFTETMVDYLVGAARDYGVPIPDDWGQRIADANARAFERRYNKPAKQVKVSGFKHPGPFDPDEVLKCAEMMAYECTLDPEWRGSETAQLLEALAQAAVHERRAQRMTFEEAAYQLAMMRPPGGLPVKRWILDGFVDLRGVCEDENWHLASVVRFLVTLGISRRDAEAYADFMFHENAATRDPHGGLLTPEQRARLTRAE